MIINEAYEGYTMLLGFFLNNRIWEVMLITGVFALPILIMVVQSIVKAYAGGDDEGDRGSMALRYIEIGTIKIALVMIFCMFPLGEPLTLTSMSYNNHTCEAATPDQIKVAQLLRPTDDAPLVNKINTSVNGVEPRPPIMIALVQNYSTKFTNAVVSSIPCSTDIVSIGMSVENTNIKQRDTQDVLVDFIGQCYGPLFKQATITQNMEADEVYDKYWIGAPYFMGGESGGEAVYALSTSTATVPLETYIDNIRRGFNSAPPSLQNGQYAAQGNYQALDSVQNDGNVILQCDHYYNILEAYVEQDYAEEIADLNSPYVINSLDAVSLLWNKYFSDDPDNPTTGTSVIMKRLVEAVNNFNATSFEKTSIEGDGALDYLQDLFVGVGSGISGVKKMTETWFVRLLANPLLAMVQCLVFIMAPIIFLLSNYNMKIIGQYLVTIFGLEVIVLIFEVCDWMNDNLFWLTASAYSQVDSSHGTTQIAIFNAAQWSYFVLPLLWMTILGKVGMMVSNGLAQGISSASQSASKEGLEQTSKATGKLAAGASSAFEAGKKLA